MTPRRRTTYCPTRDAELSRAHSTRLPRGSPVKADAAIGVVTTASFAIGVALISRYKRFTRSFDAALYGNILGVQWSDIWVVVGVTLLIGALVFFGYKQLLFTTFDPEVAPIYGVRTAWLDTLFALALAAALIASMQILGVTLIASALVVPAITARLLTDSFARMLLLSTVIGAVAGFVGIYLSYYFDIASAASIVLVQTAGFMLALLTSLARKRLSQRLLGDHH